MVPLHIHVVVKGLWQHAYWEPTLFVNINKHINKWCSRVNALQIRIQTRCKQNQKRFFFFFFKRFLLVSHLMYPFYVHSTEFIGALSPLGGDNSGQKTGVPGVKNHCKGCKGALFPLNVMRGSPLLWPSQSWFHIFIISIFYFFCSVCILITTERGIGIFVCVPWFYYPFNLSPTILFFPPYCF